MRSFLASLFLLASAHSLAATPLPVPAVEVAVSDNAACALKPDGTVACWGASWNGELGFPGDWPMTFNGAIAVAGVSGATRLVAGSTNPNFCAIVGGGAVICWGGRVYGFLGIGSPVPMLVYGVSGAVALEAGTDGMCAVLADGTATCWGHGTLYGYGGADGQPAPMSGVTNAAGLALHGPAPCYTTTTGSILCRQGTAYLPIAPGLPPATSISGGFAHACASFADLSVRCWGRNSSGQLGDGTQVDRPAPTLVPGATATRVVARGDSTCAINSSGSTCWGSVNQQLSPAPLPGSNFTHIAIGPAVCLVAAGIAECYGSNAYGQLGDNQPPVRRTPVAPVVPGIVQLSGGANHTCAVLASGEVSCWGRNSRGQLGDGTRISRPTPMTVPGLSGVSRVAVSRDHTCALASGTVSCWGAAETGAVGYTGTVQLTPFTVPGIAGAVDISAAALHSCALLGSGEVRCWGYLAFLNPPFTTSPPVPVPAFENAVALSGADGTCARLASGEVRCISWIVSGTEDVPHLAGATSIAKGWGTICGAMPNGEVRCAGRSEIETGMLAPPGPPAPAVVPGVSTATKVVSGRDFQCALVAGGRVVCWGVDPQESGLFGEGRYREFPGITGAVDLMAGGTHACVRYGDGAVRCWGNNRFGEVGDGLWEQRATRAPVVSFTRTPTTITLASAGPSMYASGFPAIVATVTGDQPSGWLEVRHVGSSVSTESELPIAANGVMALPVTFSPGTYTLQARFKGDAVNLPSEWSNEATQVIVRATQSVTAYPAIPSRALNAPPLVLQPWYTSALRVAVFTSLTPAVCAVSGNTVALLTAGTCILSVGHPGDTYYEAAAPVTTSFTVTPNVITSRRASDADGTGSVDVFWTGAGGEAAVWLMNGLSTNGSALLLGPGTGWSMANTAGDFNNDGRSDILWSNTDGSWAIWLMDGTSVVGSAVILGPATGWSVTHVDDFDGDNRSDLLWRNVDGSVAMWTMNGVSAATSELLFGPATEWRVTHTGDLDGDARADLLWRNAASGLVAGWLMNGTTIASSAIVFDVPEWSIVLAGDFNGDGRKDIVWRHGATQQVNVWLMNGLARTANAPLPLGTYVPTHLADFNFDGMADVIATNPAGAVAILLMNGINVLSSTIVFGGGNGWAVAQVGDFNGDGPADILWRDAGGQVAVWMMNGAAVVGSGLIFGGGGWVPAP